MFKQLGFCLLLSVYGLSGCSASSDDSSGGERFDKRFKSIIVVADASRVRLTRVDSPISEVTYNVVGSPATQTVSISGDGDTLTVEAKKSAPSVDSRVDFNISVMDTETVFMKMGAGSVDLLGLSATTRISLGQGDVNVDAPLSGLDLTLGQGFLRAAGLRGDVRVNIAQGRGELAFAGVSAGARSIDLKSGQGDFKVKLPDGSSVGWTPERPKAMFSILSDFPNTPGGLYRIAAKIAMGRLKISKY